jgi:hypothetical protein
MSVPNRVCEKAKAEGRRSFGLYLNDDDMPGDQRSTWIQTKINGVRVRNLSQ